MGADRQHVAAVDRGRSFGGEAELFIDAQVYDRDLVSWYPQQALKVMAGALRVREDRVCRMHRPCHRPAVVRVEDPSLVERGRKYQKAQVVHRDNVAIDGALRPEWYQVRRSMKDTGFACVGKLVCKQEVKDRRRRRKVSVRYDGRPQSLFLRNLHKPHINAHLLRLCVELFDIEGCR
jgi:hypothetical protein